MELLDIVVHNLIKDIDTDPELELAKKTLPVNETTSEFANQIKEKYFKRQPIYGVFNEDTKTYYYQNYVNNLLEEKTSFLEFTTNSVYILTREIKKKRATGGYVVFLRLNMKGNEYIAVAMIHNTKRFNINNSLEVQELISLDIEQLDIANFLNLTKWQDKNRSEDETYLSFQKGKKQITEYFTEFIGCTNKTTAKKSSENLKRALHNYFKEFDYKESDKKSIRNKVFDYCDLKVKGNLELSLDAISALINPDEPTSFKTFASSEEYQVNSVFYGSSTVLKEIKFAKYKMDGVSIEFDKTLLNKTVFYDKKKQSLLFKKIPSDLLD